MARQYLQDGPYIDPPVTSPLSADVTTTAIAAWSGAQFTPLFAGAFTMAPGLGTSAPGTTCGSSIAQTVPASSLSGPWWMKFVFVVRTIGAAGANSTGIGSGMFQSGGVAATANSGLNVPIGGTSCAFDATVNNFFTFTKTLSVAGSFTTHWCTIYAMN